MHKTTSSIIRLLAIFFCVLTLANCRTTLKPINDSDEAVPVEMQIIGLRPADQERSELVYTLSRCGSSNVNGVKGEGNKVTFQAQGVKKDDQCDVRIETGNTDIGVANWKEEAGLMYTASRVKINSSEGKLYGLAFVQQKYVSPPTIPNTITPAPVAMIWKLKVDMTAPNAVANCTCTIKCSPALANNVAMHEPEAQNLGHCTFANLVSEAAKTTSCTSVMLQCGSEFYLGSWPGNAVVNGSTSGDVSLPAVSLTRGTPDATSDATIEVVIPQ